MVVLAKNACDQEGRRRFVFVNTGITQFSIMRARMASDDEFRVIIEHMNMKQIKAVGHVGAKAKTDERSLGGPSGTAL